MKTTKIVIKNLFGIKETELDGRSVEISGPKGSGKTSVLDSIRYALTNRSDRDYIVHRGADEGEILIETDTGLSIDRKALPAKSAGTVKVRDGSLLQTRPAEFLSQIFTPLQLNPVEFTQLSRQEKNRVILNLIEFAWDTNWIREQFGEIPQGVDYSKHILEVLHDIQAENGVYFQSRQNINRDIRNKQAFVSDIAKDIPSGYDFDHWNTYPIGEKYRELESLKEQNNVIERARTFRNSHEAKLRGLEGQRDLDIAAIDRKTSEDRTRLTADIERLKAEIRLYEERLAGLDERREESVRVVISSFNEKKAKLERDAGIADQYIGRELADTTALSKEIDTAEAINALVYIESVTEKEQDGTGDVYCTIALREYVDLEAQEVATLNTTRYTGNSGRKSDAAKDIAYHRVVSGDTLSMLCRRTYGDGTASYYNALAKYNGISNPHLIYVGQTIKLPPKDILLGGG